MRERERRGKDGIRIRSEGPEKKGKGPFCEVEGHDCEKRERGKGGCKRQGVEKEKSQRKPGETLGFGG